ncbi:E3 ubiquitin-protein ligase RZF1-like [Punica granatum]|uniref:RING-type E3 ubiquitin transferase n=2 Tax=Punica granatum TaxID=22663 RepID=A0A218WL60_PUNGR|nr:E3 ubiquitin-protein ligase RZF1-like [Punica granatum]OWM73567.1 hypothetical protein CDL15_Pgr026666 [Punica granatum]PKI41189.1 hypothetical protein CRG98_038405 [Punica granatum]
MHNGAETHWCYQCNQSFGLRGQEVICPYCHGGFVQELSEMQGFASEEDAFMTNQRDLPPRVPRIFDAMYALMGENGLNGRSRLMQFVDLLTREEMAGRNPNFDVRGRSGLVPDRGWEDELSPSSYFVYQGPVSGSAFPRSGMERVPRHVDLEEYFTGMGLQELIEQLSLNDRRGPPPAPRSAINAMPTIRITRAHIQSDSQCPVCKEEFEIDSEAKMMPCHHIYHSDCIIPWLVQHNSCPVCRYEMPAQGTVSELNPGTGQGIQSPSGQNRGTSNGGGRESGHQNPGRRTRFPRWPFRPSGSNSNQQRTESGGSGGSPSIHEPNHEMNYSGWPFDY